MKHKPIDTTGNRIRVGDTVKVMGVPDLTGLAPESFKESLPVFEHLVGKYKTVEEFDEYGFAFSWRRGFSMCRNIRTLHNFKPPATDEEIRASSIQFVRKLSGFTRPSKTNELAFNRAVDEVTKAAHDLLDSLVTNAPPRDREVEASKARAKAAARYGTPDAKQAT